MTTSANTSALIDTNVLVYASDASAPQHAAARALRDAGVSGSFSLCLSAQVLFEFVTVVTNPKRMKRPQTMKAAWVEVDKLTAVFRVLPMPPDLFEQVQGLVPTVRPKGVEVFDLAIAVTALSAGLSDIYTYDPSIFGRVPGIVVRTP